MTVGSACYCIGPQDGQPYCPCRMRGMNQRDGGWVRPEQDVDLVRPKVWPSNLGTGHGCICPAGAEKTCAGPLCPRRPIA